MTSTTFQPRLNPLAPPAGIVTTIGDATLIHGDAYAILPTLGAFDALVMDPPYVIDTSGGGRFRKDRPQMDAIRAQGLDQGFDVTIINPLLYGSTVTFCHNDQLLDVLRQLTGCYERVALLAWHKANPQPLANKHYRPDTELWLHGWTSSRYAPQGTLEQKARYWIGDAPRGKDRFGHPTPKPLALMEKIVANVAGDSIVDPFMGTGTTGVAAIRAGRRFTGIEHDITHYQTAVTRITAAVKEQSLSQPASTGDING